MSYFKYRLPSGILNGVVIMFNGIKGHGVIRENSGAEFPFSMESVLCRRIETGCRVTFRQGVDRNRPAATMINKY